MVEAEARGGDYGLAAGKAHVIQFEGGQLPCSWELAEQLIYFCLRIIVHNHYLLSRSSNGIMALSPSITAR